MNHHERQGFEAREANCAISLELLLVDVDTQVDVVVVRPEMRGQAGAVPRSITVVILVELVVVVVHALGRAAVVARTARHGYTAVAAVLRVLSQSILDKANDQRYGQQNAQARERKDPPLRLAP